MLTKILGIVLVAGTAMATNVDLAVAFNYDIGAKVPEKQVMLIKKGLTIAEDYLNKIYGGAIPRGVANNITVKIEATGKGNQEPGGGGGAATGLDETGPRPYFDVAHVQWAQNTEGRGWTRETDQLKTVVHEYTHGWQAWLGVLDMHSQPLGNWMNEGIAEYIAYNAIIATGKMSKRNADRFMLNASSGEETASPLKAFGSSRTSAWPGHVGYVAIDWLVSESPNGPMSLRILATEVAGGRSVKQAFAKAFNIELDDFYEQFEVWRPAIRKSPGKALSRRPKLVNIGE
ncbi:MAG: hypothetical protein Q8M47_13085 [Devosia sp.]|jgi:hypothetical protein|nr:hypothetical protein [Devosia sp.]